MALADYRLCDKCGEKTFYDVNLNYDFDDLDEVGNPALENVGDWVVLCKDCASKYIIVIVDKQAESEGQ